MQTPLLHWLDRARATAARTPTWVLFSLGAIWDWFTLRADRLADNVLLAGYLAALGALLFLDLRAGGDPLPGRQERVRGWLQWAEPFLLGALLSAFLIAVVRSIHPGPAAAFAAGLFLVVLLNEWQPGPLREHAIRAGLFAFCGYQLIALAVPLVTLEVVPAPVPAALSLLGTLALVLGARWHRPARDRIALIGGPIAAAALSVIIVWTAVRAGAIPPLPLVMQDSALVEDVRWKGNDLQIRTHPTDMVSDLGLRPAQVEIEPGEGLTVLSAIGAPEGMELALVHRWEWFDGERWQASDTIPLDVRGGLEQGFRTWSTKRNLKDGRWRVRVLTAHAQELGRVRVDVTVRG